MKRRSNQYKIANNQKKTNDDFKIAFKTEKLF